MKEKNNFNSFNFPKMDQLKNIAHNDSFLFAWSVAALFVYTSFR